MDPIYHYLNRIPIVLSVQGYIDDNTIAGPSGDLTWCMHVQYCYRKIGGNDCRNGVSYHNSRMGSTWKFEHTISIREGQRDGRRGGVESSRW